jgi:hypothetical protein
MEAVDRSAPGRGRRSCSGPDCESGNPSVAAARACSLAASLAALAILAAGSRKNGRLDSRPTALQEPVRRGEEIGPEPRGT